MRKLLSLSALVAIFAISCQQEITNIPQTATNQANAETSFVRDYNQALAIAEEAVAMVDASDTRSSKPRKIMSGQVVTNPVTRGGDTNEEPIMYIFNNEDNQGFTIIAADKSHPALIATTELGNYTYGEPTGVEPFDLMMEDVANNLRGLIPDANLAIMTKIENEHNNPYGPLANVQWGVGTIYGSLYPDDVAYDEAAAIAQALISYQQNLTYTVTNPNSSDYGSTYLIARNTLGAHFRYDHAKFQYTSCSTAIHDQIARLYLEIGYRLSQNTSISLSNKTTSFPMVKVKSVLASFGVGTGAITSFSGNPILPRTEANTFGGSYKKDSFIFCGTMSTAGSLPNGGRSHYWLANGFNKYTYDYVTYTLNSILDPSHPNPNDYTETARESRIDYLLYFNWGFDGISNGWFHSGCFDMSERVEDTSGNTINPNPSTSEYDYNFSNISFFSQLDPTPSAV